MRRNVRQPRGLALVMVLVVIGVATVMALCLLGAASLQAQTAFNAARTANVETLAESGLELAAYYLRFPRRAPQRVNGAWPGQTGITIPGLDGTVDVTVSGSAPDANGNCTVYQVTAAAAVPTPTGTARHTAAARVNVAWGFGLEEGQAAAFGGSITLGNRMTITGDVHGNQTLSVDSGSAVYGTARAVSIVSTGGAITTPTLIAAADRLVVPTFASIKNYAAGYAFDGAPGLPQQPPGTLKVATPMQLTLADITLGPAPPGNPGGVYVFEGNVVLLNNVHINGTLVVKGGRLIVNGANNTIVAQSGLPALVVERDILMNTSNRTLDVSGLSYLGTGVTRSGITDGCRLTFTGALVLGATAALDPNYSPGVLAVQYDAARLRVPDFSATAMQVPVNFTVVTWRP